MSKETRVGVRARQGRDVENTYIGCQEDLTKGEEYKGNSSLTASGLTCQMWSAKEPHSHGKMDVGDHNYCRNPGGTKEGVYCFTMDPNTRWQYCPVPLCGTGT